MDEVLTLSEEDIKTVDLETGQPIFRAEQEEGDTDQTDEGTADEVDDTDQTDEADPGEADDDAADEDGEQQS